MEEVFSPLLGIQFSLKEKTLKGAENNILTKLGSTATEPGVTPTKSAISGQLEYGQKRNIALNLASLSLVEKTEWNITGSFNFKKNNVKLPFRTADGKIITLKNDLSLRLTLTFRDAKNIIRQLDNNTGTLNFLDNKLPNDRNTILQPGSIRIFDLVPSMDYQVNKAVSLTFTMNIRRTTPYVSSDYINHYTMADLKVKLNLAEL